MNLQEALEKVEADPDFFKTMPLAEVERLAEEVANLKLAERQQAAIKYYQPVSAEARRYHLSTAKQRIVIGGNGSSKSETQLVDIVIEMTGIVPFGLEDSYPRQKLRPPIAARLVLQSLTNTWEQSMKPKLIWNKWTGLADGIHGHYGWIPRHLLIKGKWDESWSEKYRTLTLTNGSTLQIMSHDQDPADAASASLHRIGFDEGPRHVAWRENMFRLREGGYISLGMTPPDDESTSWQAAWVYDELYQKGLPGPGKEPHIDSFTFDTLDNPHIDQATIALITKGLTQAQKETRLRGAFMHLGGRIYPTYTDVPRMWCFNCNQAAAVSNGVCAACKGKEMVEFCHSIEPDEYFYRYPAVFLIDPHPRKMVMMSWTVITPSDDYCQIAEMNVDDDPEGISKKVFDFERRLGINVVLRGMDPNMAESAAHNAGKRHVSVRDEYDAVGLRCKLMDDDFAVGKGRVRQLLKPDPRTKLPRWSVFSTCHNTSRQMKNYSWGEWARGASDDKDPKAVPRAKDDDYPTLLKYLANENPTFAALNHRNESMMRIKKRA